MPSGSAARLNPAVRSVVMSVSLALCGLLTTMIPAAVQAQQLRVIPADASYGRLVIDQPVPSQPLSASLDGKPVGVAPGMRLFGVENQLLTLAAAAGAKLDVRYKLDLYGQLLSAWILSETELKSRPR